MNRRDLLKMASILPLPFSRKFQLDRVVTVQVYRTKWRPGTFETIDRFDGGYFEVAVIKEIITTFDHKNHFVVDSNFDLSSDFDPSYSRNRGKIILKDGNGNILEVNKLNKGFVLLKLEMIKWMELQCLLDC